MFIIEPSTSTDFFYTDFVHSDYTANLMQHFCDCNRCK